MAKLKIKIWERLYSNFEPLPWSDSEKKLHHIPEELILVRLYQQFLSPYLISTLSILSDLLKQKRVFCFLLKLYLSFFSCLMTKSPTTVWRKKQWKKDENVLILIFDYILIQLTTTNYHTIFLSHNYNYYIHHYYNKLPIITFT